MRIIFTMTLFTLVTIVSMTNGQVKDSIINRIEKDYARGDFESVEKRIRTQLKSYKHQAYYYDRLGEIYYHKGQLDSALYFLNIAVSFDGNDSGVRFTRSLILNDKKKYKEALVDMNKAIESFPENAVFYNYRAFIHLNLKNKKMAKSDLERTKELALKLNNLELYKSADIQLKDWFRLTKQ
jgi:tetratricopeptide (TPR) repeat protein